MSFRKLALIAVAGVALLLVIGVAMVAWFDRPLPPGAAGGAAGTPATPEAAPAVATPAAEGNAVGEPLISPPQIGARPRAASSVAWEFVPAAARLSDLGPGLAAPVNAGLRAARDTMDSCFEEETRLLASRPAPKYDPDRPPTGPAVLVLRLESRMGGLDVADVELESLGTSTAELVECARHVLRGLPIEAPAATPGKRYRLKYLLQ